MRRRDFLGAVGTATMIGLAGCSSVNPFSDEHPRPPTDAQLEYIEFYPPVKKANSVPVISVSLQDGQVYVSPNSFGEFVAIELYQVQPDGSGSKINTLQKSQFGPNASENSANPPKRFYDKTTVTNGTVMLVLCVTPSGTKYTYGAFTVLSEETGLRNVAYTKRSTTQN